MAAGVKLDSRLAQPPQGRTSDAIHAIPARSGTGLHREPALPGTRTVPGTSTEGEGRRRGKKKAKPRFLVSFGSSVRPHARHRTPSACSVRSCSCGTQFLPNFAGLANYGQASNHPSDLVPGYYAFFSYLLCFAFPFFISFPFGLTTQIPGNDFDGHQRFRTPTGDCLCLLNLDSPSTRTSRS